MAFGSQLCWWFSMTYSGISCRPGTRLSSNPAHWKLQIIQRILRKTPSPLLWILLKLVLIAFIYKGLASYFKLEFSTRPAHQYLISCTFEVCFSINLTRLRYRQSPVPVFWTLKFYSPQRLDFLFLRFRPFRIHVKLPSAVFLSSSSIIMLLI